MTNIVWTPLEDGLYLDGALAISYKGTDIGLKVDDEPYKGDDWVGNYVWLSDCEVRDIRVKEERYRLCRATPTPQPLTMPDEVRDAIEGLRAFVLVHLTVYYKPKDDDPYLSYLRIVREWLDQHPQPAKEGE